MEGPETKPVRFKTGFDLQASSVPRRQVTEWDIDACGIRSKNGTIQSNGNELRSLPGKG